jgi:peptidyl-prolyl cis-trans isomerase D
MLKSLSRLERTRSLIIIVFAVLMGISLILFYAPNRGAGSTAAATDDEVLARVGDGKVTVGELGARKDMYRQMLGGQFNPAMFGGDRRMLDALIREEVVAHEAARLGLRPSDAEVARMIRQEFSVGGNFVGLERYRETVTAQYGGVEQFEEGIRNSVASEKLRAFLTAGVQVSDAEVLDEFKRGNTTFEIVYVPVTVERLAARINPSDEELRNYFNEHRTDFRILEAQKKIRYLYIDQAKIGERLQISDEELRAAFSELTPENRMAGARVQQIVLRFARPELEDETRTRAAEIVRELRAAGQEGRVSEEAFGERARGRSEDPATARNGGALANIVRRNPNNPSEPLQQTLPLQEGMITDPVKVGNAFYIFRRGPSVEKTFDDARPELLASIRNRRSYGEAARLASRAAERLRALNGDVRRVAEELHADANMTVDEMVKETPFVKPGDDVPNIGSSPQFEQAIAPLEQPNQVGDQTGVRGGFAIPVLVERRDPRIPEFDEVREGVLNRFRQERARSQLEQIARELAGSANNPDELRAAATRFGLEAQTANEYRLRAPLGDAGTSPVLDEIIFNSSAGTVARTPVQVNDKWVVVSTARRTDPDLAQFEQQRTELTQNALATRRNAVFEDYVSAARARMERDGRIRVYDDVLARIAADEPILSQPNIPFPMGGDEP